MKESNIGKLSFYFISLELTYLFVELTAVLSIGWP